MLVLYGDILLPTKSYLLQQDTSPSIAIFYGPSIQTHESIWIISIQTIIVPEGILQPSKRRKQATVLPS